MSTSYYTRWTDNPAYRASRERKAALIDAVCGERIRTARRVVDLGAGTGLIRKALEERSRRPIVGFDIDRAFITETERMVVADLQCLPLKDSAVDFGIANHVYEHVPDLGRFFNELRRILAPDGAVYLTAGNKYALIEPHYRIPTLSWWPKPVANRLLRWSRRGEKYDDIRFHTHGRLTATALRHGIALVDITDGVLMSELARYDSRSGRITGRAAARLPARLRRRLLMWLSPQWFFLARPVEVR